MWQAACCRSSSKLIRLACPSSSRAPWLSGLLSQSKPAESFIPEHAELAIMVARYDRVLAARVLQASLDDLGKLSLSHDGVDEKTHRVLCAEILVDPRRAVERIEALPDSSTATLNGFAPGKNDTVMNAAKLLSLHGEDRWRHIYDHYLLLWTPDQE